MNTKEKLEKFDSKTDIGIFLGYSSSSIAYRVFNKRTLEESINEVFDESYNNISNEFICSSIIGTKWVFRNKIDENGNIIRNKARLEFLEIKLMKMEISLEIKLDL